LPQNALDPPAQGLAGTDEAVEVLEASEASVVVDVPVAAMANPTMPHRRKRMAKNFILSTLF